VLEETIRERVARGAALMDSKGPKNWRETCRVPWFDIMNPDRCVLGLCFDCYGSGLFDLDIMEAGDQKEIDHGFRADIRNAQYSRLLQKAWLEQLNKKS
jgi:hypothetical protein